MVYNFLKIPLILEPQDEGGWVITSPLLPELITEVDSLKELHEVVTDATQAVLELYEDMGKSLPVSLMESISGSTWFESLISLER